MDKKMNNISTWIFGFIAMVAGILTIYSYLQSNIEKKIEAKVNDPIFLKKIADEVRLPFLIFDEKNKILADFGAYKYLKKIHVLKNDKNELIGIKISPNNFMNIPPILESINSDIDFHEPERAEEIDWLIKIIPPPSRLLLEEPREKSVIKFKLTIIK